MTVSIYFFILSFSELSTSQAWCLIPLRAELWMVKEEWEGMRKIFISNDPLLSWLCAP